MKLPQRLITPSSARAYALLVVLLLGTAQASLGPPDLTSPRIASDAAAAAIAGRYIVRLQNAASAASFESELRQMVPLDASNENAAVTAADADDNGNLIVRRYTTAIVGYAGYFNDTVLEWLRTHPTVASVEPDAVGFIDVSSKSSDKRMVQWSPPSWGLKRLSNRALDGPNKYVYPSSAGKGITVYVVDTGIDIAHPEFGGRASWGNNFVIGEPAADLNGHGTAVAGTVASKTYGVAKKAHVVAVKVCDQTGSCTKADTIAALDWVVQNAKRHKSIINISLGGAPSSAEDAAVQAAFNAGIPVIVAAGNFNMDSCLASPSRAPAAFAVGASTDTDQKASFSNFGACVKLFAPGVNIVTTAPSSGTTTISGTSFSSPYVAGIAALYMSVRKYYSVSELYRSLVKNATPNVVTGVPAGTTTALAYSVPKEVKFYEVFRSKSYKRHN